MKEPDEAARPARDWGPVLRVQRLLGLTRSELAGRRIVEAYLERLIDGTVV